MAIPVAAPGGSCSAPRATAIFPNIMALRLGGLLPHKAS
jgi:hypothetical protein